MTDKFTSLAQRLTLDRDHAAAIGYFLIAFSHLEEEMNRAIWIVLEIQDDNRAFVITSSLRDFGQRMLLLTKLAKAHLRHTKDRTDCSNVVRAISYLNDRRVDIVHSAFIAWDPSRSLSYLHRTKADRDEVRQSVSIFSTSYLCELTEFTLTVAQALRTFRYNVRHRSDEELPSLDKRPVQPT